MYLTLRVLTMLNLALTIVLFGSTHQAYANTILGGGGFSPTTAQNGVAEVLTVVTDTATLCLDLSTVSSGPTFTAQTTTPSSSNATSKTWKITVPSGSYQGQRTIRVKAYDTVGCTSGNKVQDYSFVDVAFPATSITLTPGTPDGNNGWYKSDVKITIAASNSTTTRCVLDPATAPTTYADLPSTPCAYLGVGANVTTDGQHTIYAASTGTSGTESVVQSQSFKIDKTSPTATASAKVDANAYTGAWTNQSVVVHFTGQDGSGSGIASCTADVTVSSEGANQTSPSGTCTDNAGNVSNAVSFSPINIDTHAPNISVTAKKADNSAYSAGSWTNQNVTFSYTCSDPNISEGPPVVAGSGVNTGASSLADDAFTATGVANATCVDNAGNQSATANYDVKIDKVPPTIKGSRDPAANSNGWNNSDVTVSFECSDGDAGPGTSGIASCTPSSKLTTDGANQSVPGTAVDQAGNSATTTVSNINIDKTKPTLSGAPTTPPNGAGWYNASVTIQWSCSDGNVPPASGIDGTCPANSNITGDGTGQTAQASVSDKAGNTTTANSSPAVNIDTVAPNTTADAPAAWNNLNVTVELKASDGMSGVKATYYTLDGGSQQTGTSVQISSEGIHTLEYWSVDNADNSETHKTAQIKIDKTPPTIKHDLNPLPNGAGWNNSNVTVTFICDDGAGSGIASCTDPQIVETEGANQPVPGQAVDNAGNSADDPATVSVDKTAPTIEPAVAGVLGKNGWYVSTVKVSFTCDDTLSGITINGCTPAQTLGDGANQSVTGSASDTAGNSSSVTVDKIYVDTTAPTLSGAAKTGPNSNGWYNGDVMIAWTCNDSGSGIDGACPPDSTISGEGANLSDSASVSDIAGNTTTASVTGIKIDRTPPNTTASVPDPVSGWYADSVLVTLNTKPDLSGVAQTNYTIDNGSAQLYTAPFSVGGGVHTIKFWSVDNAGNVEDATASTNSITVQVDDAAPTITGSRNPSIGNANGWNNTPVDISFDCQDTQSGIATCLGDTTLGEGAAQSVEGTATDKVGKSAKTTVSGINIDLTKPEIKLTAKNADGTAYSENSWTMQDVTVSYTCVDVLSNVDSSASSLADDVLSVSGTASATCVDNAGNSTSVSFSVLIDKTPPEIAPIVSGTQGDNDWYVSDVNVSWSVYDPESDVSSTTGCDPVTINTDTKGTTLTCTATSMGGEASFSKTIMRDTTPPSISGAKTPVPNGNGWNNSKVTVDFSCTDATSGIASCGPKPQYFDVAKDLTATGTAVDNAGNSAQTTVDHINVDQTDPTISGAKSPAANGNGWHNSDVTVTFTCDDADLVNNVVSGVATCTTPQTVTTEGEDQKVTGSVTDKADNKASTDVFVSLDKTKPVADTTLDPIANAAGWWNSPVTVKFIATDKVPGSGVDNSTCTAPQTFSSEGTFSATGSCSDVAGNVSDPVTASNIRIDLTAPTVQINTKPASSVNVDTAAFTFSGTDTGGSGIVKYECSLDGDPFADCTSGSANYKDLSTGTRTFKVHATDAAGNVGADATYSWNVTLLQPIVDAVENGTMGKYGWYVGDVTVSWNVSGNGAAIQSQTGCGPTTISTDTAGTTLTCSVTTKGGTTTTSVTIKRDTAKPTISGAIIIGSLNGAGWYNSDVTVRFTCGDGSMPPASGIHKCSDDMTVSSDGANQSVTGTATDKAGNSTSATVSGINLDKTSPTASAAIDPAPNLAGWNKSAVIVKFSGTDTLSGLAGCTANVPWPTETTGQPISGICTDKAGNQSLPATANVKIDLTKPVVLVTGVTNGGKYVLGKVPTIGCSTTDAVSKVATPATLSVNGANANGVGTITATCSGAVDNAGNSQDPVSVTFSVTYSFGGFYEPVQNPSAVNKAEAGSSIPLKFTLGGNYGMNILAAGSPSSQQVSCTSPYAPIGASSPTVSNETPSLVIEKDGEVWKYKYIWKTDKAWQGTCRLLTVSFNDGTSKTALFQFKSDSSGGKTLSTVAVVGKSVFLPLVKR